MQRILTGIITVIFLGLMCVGTRAQTRITALSHEQAVATAQTITSDAAGAVVDVTGYSQVLLTVRGTYVVVTIPFEASPDATNYFPLACTRTDSSVTETASGALTNTTRAWRCNVTGFTRFRTGSATDWTSGTVNVTITPVAAASDLGIAVGQANAANLNATVTGTVSINALPAGTNNIGDVDVLTLPALPTGSNTIGGVNLAQYTPVSGRLPVDGSGVTQPVSGTVTANAGTGNFTVIQGTASSLKVEPAGNVASGATDSGNPLKVGGVYNSTLPTLTNGQRGDVQLSSKGQLQNVLMDAAGNGRGANVNASNQLSVSVDNTVAVASHNVTNAGTFAVQAAQSGTWTVQPGNTANTTAWLVTGTGGTFPATQSGTWNVTNISGTVSLPTGASTESTLSALNTKINTEVTSDFDTGAGTQTMKLTGFALPASGGAVVGGTATNPLRTDPTGTTTQPVSGTVSVNALPAGTNNIGDVDVLTLPALPAGSNTIGNVNLAQYTPTSGRLPVDGSGVTQPVSGSVTANAGTNLNTSALALESGGNLATIAGAIRAEDAAHVSAHTGIMALSVRQDTAAQLAGTDGDYSPLITDSSGRLHVSVGNTVTVGSHNVTNAGTFAVQAAQSGTWTVQPGNTANTTAWLVTGTGGTFPATQSGTWNLNNISGTISLPTGASTESTLSALNAKLNTEITADYDTGAGTQTMKYVGIALPASGGAVAGGTSTNPLRTDPTGTTTQPVSGTVSVNALPAGTNNIGDVDVLTLPALPTGSNTIGGVNLAQYTPVSGRLPVDGSGVTQPISASSLPLPTGAATAANQTPAYTPIAPGTATATSGVMLGYQYNSTQATFTNGQQGSVQGSSRGALYVATGADTFNVTVNTALPTGSNVIGAVTQSGNWSVRNQDGSGIALTSASRGSERALSVQIVDGSGNQVTSFGGAGGTSSSFGSAVPSSGTAAGFSDGTNMQLARVHDLDSSGGTQYNLGVSLRRTANGSSAELLGNSTMANSLPVTIASDQSALSTTDNITQIGGNSISTGNGSSGTGVQRVTIANDSTGVIGLVPLTAGGLTISKTISAGSTNATSVKASAGQVYAIYVINTNAAVRYLKLYNKASSPTVGTDTPVMTLPISGSTTGGGFVFSSDVGIAFATGIAFALTTGVLDSDTGAVASSEIVVNLLYK